MEREYDGTISSIDLPDMILLEVQHSVLIESNYLDTMSVDWVHPTGSKLRIETALFEKYFGDEEHSDVPVVKYSTRSYAPALCGQLRLRTPNYYRGLEVGETGLSDPFEGCRFSHQWGPGSEMVMRPEDGSGRSFVFDASGATKIDLCTKTFMYCTSLDSESSLLDLEKANALYGPDYTHGSVFRNSKELARHILAGFAKIVSRSMLETVKIDGEESVETTYPTYAWIVHGPVLYLRDAETGIEGIKSYFTKPDNDIYRHQNEYRFWIGFENTPAQSDEAAILLPIPEDIATVVALE